MTAGLMVNVMCHAALCDTSVVCGSTRRDGKRNVLSKEWWSIYDESGDSYDDECVKTIWKQ